jgi:glyoxylase-like metal-dependent hydrolase (beta-lactamase superfamily II)
VKNPPAYATFETSSGARIHRLPVAAFPGMWANAWLVETDDMLALVDTGSGSEHSNETLAAGFDRAGRRIEDLTHILLTHGHIDHFGGLPYLRSRANALVGVHELDLQTITRHDERLAVLSRRLETFLCQSGVPAGRRESMLQLYRMTKAFYRSIPVDFTYEAQDMRVGPFELIHIPGHCPGHVALKLHDAVFCGDLVLDDITPHQSPEELIPFMGVRHYLASLSALEGWAAGASLALNGHDDPIPDLPVRAAAIRQNIQRRLDQTLAALDQPRTVAEIAEIVYGQIGGYNALLVVEKIGAYVEYLYQRGLLAIANLDELEDREHSPKEMSPAVIRYYRLPEPVNRIL